MQLYFKLANFFFLRNTRTKLWLVCNLHEIVHVTDILSQISNDGDKNRIWKLNVFRHQEFEKQVLKKYLENGIAKNVSKKG